ncbi:hypothetical protein CEXT_278541 [Caerostris extrusa]|uniref:Uncharacterized protein n=1 Tax=Caerostris extrusa TaxID=172846 RepID=A0AAV4QBG0_CAEEX|nr:hypothetical protein CEXT_278541 [Caerostris extrusa]
MPHEYVTKKYTLCVAQTTKDCAKVPKKGFIVMNLIQQLQKSAHVIHLNKKYSSSKYKNHLTIGEARRLYAQSSKTNYSDAAKMNTTVPNIQEIVNQRVESIVQSITIKIEQQTTILIEIFQKTIENIVQHLITVFNQNDLKKSPTENAKL